MQRPGKEENGMDHTMGILMIGAACLLVLLVAAMRSKTQIFLNFILRAVLGLLLIYFVNSFLDGRGIPVHVGLGAVSLFVSGALGAPGVLLLYGIGICAWLLGAGYPAWENGYAHSRTAGTWERRD